jgi:hypothetical protein
MNFLIADLLTAAQVAPYLSALIATVAAGIAIWSGFMNRRSKTVDAIAWCMKEYYDLHRVALTYDTSVLARSYFDRLWGTSTDPIPLLRPKGYT